MSLIDARVEAARRKVREAEAYLAEKRGSRGPVSHNGLGASVWVAIAEGRLARAQADLDAALAEQAEQAEQTGGPES